MEKQSQAVKGRCKGALGNRSKKSTQNFHTLFVIHNTLQHTIAYHLSAMESLVSLSTAGKCALLQIE